MKNEFNHKSYKQRKYSVNDNYFDEMSDEKYWLLGLLASDGCVDKLGHISISQSGKDGLELIEYIKSILEFNGNIYVYKNAYSIQFSSLKIKSILEQYNIVNKKTLRYKFPENVELKSFVRGYFDGDGCIGIYNQGNSKNYLSAIIVGTKDFICELNDKLNEFNGKLRQIKRAKNLYEIRWYGKKGIKFLTWLYDNKNLYNSYKQIIFKNYMKNYNPKYEILQQEAIRLFKEGHTYKEIQNITKLSMNFLRKSKIKLEKENVTI